MNHLHINSNKKWKYRFFILITGQSISVIGSTAVQFSVIWWLSTLTASPMVLAYAGLAAYVPQILLGSFSGIWINRFDRKKVIILSDLFTGGISTLFAILLLTAAPYMGILYSFRKESGGKCFPRTCASGNSTCRGSKRKTCMRSFTFIKSPA